LSRLGPSPSHGSRFLPCFLIAFLAACSGGGGSSSPRLDPAASLVAVSPSSGIVADGASLATVTITLLTSGGKPVRGKTVVVAASGTGNTLVQPTGPTDANGTVTATLASTVAETKAITATVSSGLGGIVLAAQPTVEFIGDASTIDTALSSATANPALDVVADGAELSTVTVVVRDAHGNAVEGQTVAIAANGTGNTLVQPSAPTDASGVATATLASTVAETKTLTVTVNPGPSQVVLAEAPTVEFVGDPSTIDAALSSATADPATDVVADGVEFSMVTVVVRDANGNPVEGQTVALAASGTGNTLVQPAGPTDASGVATATLASTAAETKTVTVTVNPGLIEIVLAAQPTVGFIGDASAIDATLSSATASPDSGLLADGIEFTTVTATVRDVRGNAVPGQTVAIAASGTGNALVQPTGPTDASGVATATLASTVAETKTITVTVNPGPGEVVLAAQPTADFIADAGSIDAALSTAEADPFAGLIANGSDSSSITVVVRDAHGNPVAGQTVALAASGSGNSLVQPASPTDASGTAVGSISSTAAQVKTITVTVNPGPAQVVLAEEPLVEFVADLGDLSALLSTASASPDQGVVADGSATSTITVTVRDSYGNPAPGQTVAIASSGTGNTLGQPAGPTDANGVATATVASTVAETKTITATVNPGPSALVLGGEPTVEFIGDASTIDAALSSAAADPSLDVVADGTQASTVTVVVRDVNGNPVPGQTVAIAASGTGNTLGQPAGPSDASGTTTATVASSVAETKTITISVNPGPGGVVLVAQPTVAFIGDASTIDAALSSATADPALDVVADGTELSTVTVVVRDANGNPVEGQTVAIAASGTGNTLGQPAGPTDASGTTTATVASTVAETKTITVSVNPGPGEVVLVAQPTVAFIGDASTIDGALSSATADPATDVVADGTEVSTVTVVVRDVNGNRVEGQTVAIAASGSANTLVQPAGPTDANGVATATVASTLAETKTVTVTVNPGAGEVGLAAQPTVGFVGDPATIDAALSSATADPTLDVVANGVELSTVTVVVRDANGNLVPGQTVAIAASGTGNTLGQPAGPTDASGVATATLASTVAETKTITVTVNPGPAAVVLADQPTVAFVASTPDATLSSATANPTVDVVANGAALATVTVVVRDANGNPIGGLTVALAASGSGNTLGQPSGPTDASGVATGTLASTVAETKALTITVNPGPGEIVLADEPTVVFVGDPDTISGTTSSVEVDPAFGARANGVDEATILVTVRDVNGNPVAGQTVELSATGKSVDLSQPAAPTDASGRATGTLSTTVAEKKTVSAVIDPGPGEIPITDTADVVFIWPNPRAFHVRSSGNNANGGTSPADAFQTITQAASAVAPGDTVYVGAGTYGESVVLATSGTSADPILFRADTEGEFTGDAGDVVVDGLGALDGFRIDGADYTTIEGFIIVGTMRAGVRVGSLPTKGVRILRNVVHSNVRGVEAINADSLVVEGNRVSRNYCVAGTGGEGVRIEASLGAVVRNNLIYANDGTGVLATGGTLLLELQANTIYANAGDQVLVDGLLNTAVLTDNVLSEGAQDGLELVVGSIVLSTYNLSWGNLLSNWLGLLPGTGDFSADPVFVDPAGPDGILGGASGDDDGFELDESFPSPALDVGSGTADEIELSDGTTLADRTTRADGVLDGTAPDGATVNLGFHAAPSVDTVSDLGADDARLVAGRSAERQPLAFTWDDTASSWSTAALSPPAGASLRWIVHALSPLADSEELTLASWDGGAGLSLLRRSRDFWHEDWRASNVLPSADRRAFDVVYEASGDALVVHSDGTANPVFRARSQGTWTDEESIFVLAPGLGSVQWVELASRPGTDEVTLVYADSLLGLRAVVWDGSAWDTANVDTLETLVRTVSTKAFDVVHESESGDALVVWAGPLSTARFATRSAGSSSWTTTSGISGLGVTPAVFDVAPDPASDRIALAGLEDAAGGKEPKVAVWTGTAWSDVDRLETGTNVSQGALAGDVGIAVGWVGSTGVAIAIYADDDSGKIDWGRWTSAGGWAVQTDVAIAGKGTTESARIAVFPGQAKLLALLSDSNSDLFAATYDGTTWTITNGGAALVSDLSSIAGVPFGAAIREP
jgi:hypothetical protein